MERTFNIFSVRRKPVSARFFSGLHEPAHNFLLWITVQGCTGFFRVGWRYLSLAMMLRPYGGPGTRHYKRGAAHPPLLSEASRHEPVQEGDAESIAEARCDRSTVTCSL
jgi:hypothetical protein